MRAADCGAAVSPADEAKRKKKKLHIVGKGGGGASPMVKMSLDPVQVMTGQVTELKAAASANGDGSRGSWEEKGQFECNDLGLTTAPKPVSPEKLHHLSVSKHSSRPHNGSQHPQVFEL